MSLGETVTKFNWVDIVTICLILITSYRGSQKGFLAEMFKFLAVVFAIYVSLHYFSRVSDSLLSHFKSLDVVFSDFVCFVTLAVLSYLAIALLREVFSHFVKVEAVSLLERWGGLASGFIRGLLLASMLLIILYLSTIAYLKGSVKKSYLGSQLVLTDVKVYEFLFNGIVSKFAQSEKLNKDIYEVFEEK